MSGWWLVAVAACGGSAVIVAFGIIGLMRDGDYLIDMMVFYIAGEWHWLDVNPYGHKNTPGHLAEQGLYYRSYSYPPHFAPFTMGLALLPYRSAEVVVTVFNLAASAAIVVATVSLCGLARRPTTLQVAAITFFVLCNPFGTHVIWLGNTSLLVAAALVVGWFCLRTDRHVMAGICLGLASIKPQFVIFPVLWLLFERRWIVVLSAFVTGVVLALPYIETAGIEGALTDWLYGIFAYQGDTGNTLGFSHLFGLDSLLYALGVEIADMEAAVAGLLILAALWPLRRRLDAVTELALLQAVSVLCLPIHDYDLVVLAPLVGAFVLHARSPVAALWGILLVVAFYFPQRFMVSYDIAALLHWREALLIVAMAWLLHMQLRASRVVLSTGERKRGRYDESRAVRRRPGKGRGGEPAAPAGASPAGHGADRADL